MFIPLRGISPTLIVLGHGAGRRAGELAFEPFKQCIPGLTPRLWGPLSANT